VIAPAAAIEVREVRPKNAGPAFSLVPASALLVEPEPLEWLLDGILLPGAVGLLLGAPEAGKSLLAIDWAASIATGREWAGRPVRRAPCVYVAGEGHFGIRRRLKAWAIANDAEHELAQAPLLVSEAGAAFTDPASVDAVIEAIRTASTELGAPALVVIDTLHRNMAGDENSAADMGAYFSGIDRLRQLFGATVLTVHHLGHSAKDRGRGSSSIKAAVDVEFLLDASGTARTLTATKTKDGPRFEPIGFDLREIVLPWRDHRGTPETSIVLEHTGRGVTAAKRQTPAPLVMALETFFAAGHGRPAPLDAWRSHFYSACTADSTDGKRKAFQRARRDLVEAGALRVRDDIYTIERLAEPWDDWRGRVQMLSKKWTGTTGT
jgi:KaiC/GvpD/RAD55 family RecA-like ATPase